MQQHNLLIRQIKKYLAETDWESNEGLCKFIEAVNESYTHYDADANQSQHAFNLADREYHDITQKLTAEKNIRDQSIKMILKAIATIQDQEDNFELYDESDLLKVAEYLEKQVTLRKNAEEKIKANYLQIETLKNSVEIREKQYRELIENASDIIYELDEKGKFIFINSVITNIAGYTPDEIKNKYFWEIIHPEYLQGFIDKMMSLIKTQQDFIYSEIPVKTKEDKTIWLGQNIRMFYTHKWLTKVSVVARDITLQKINEEEIRKLSEFQHIMLNGTEYSIISTSGADNIINSFNRGAELMLGYSADEMIGKKNPAVFHDPEEIAARAKALSKELGMAIKPGNEVFNIKSTLGYSADINEWTYIKKDGSRITVELSITTLRDKENNITGYLGIAKDITEKKRVMQELEKAKDLLSQSLKISKMGYWENDLEKKVFFCSDEIYEIFEINPSHLPTIDLLLKNVSEKVKTQIFKDARTAIEKHHPVSFNYKVAVNNNVRYINGNILPVVGANGKTVKIHGTVQDITRQKEYENELLEARKNAEQSTLLKEAFLANMSHEIRTPMNAIIGFTDLLSRKITGEKEQEYIHAIKTSGNNLLTIIDDILDISKIEAQMIDFEEYPLSVKEVLKSLKTMMLKKAEDKKLLLSIHTAHDIPDLVLGDPTRLNQILINLVNNALKFTHSGSVTVFAKTLSREGENIIIEFSVTDTGIGIAEDKHENIFERFHQAESHTTRTYGGSGLGLSISKQLVILQGGKIAVQSKPGLGSVFTFTLPFKIKSDTEKVIKKAALNKFEINELSRLHILLVEDNAINIKLMLSLFKELDIKAELAENGKVAIEKLSTRSFDIVLMDMEMPEMNGYEAAIFIRKEMKSNVPIIAMTANAMAGEREKCIRFGMNDYLSKPINAEQLFLKIYQLTNMHDPLSEKNELVDLDYLLEMTDSNHETISKIMEIFLEEVPVNLLSLEKAIIAVDYPSIKKIVHHLKSSVAVLGIKPLKSMLQEIELLAGSAFNAKRIGELYPSLQELCKRAITEIEQKIGDYQ